MHRCASWVRTAHSRLMTLDEALHRNAELGAQVQRFEEELKVAQLTIEKLKVEVAYLRRMKYGRSSERLEHAQLELVGGQVMPALEADEPLPTRATSRRSMNTARSARTSRGQTCVSCRSTYRGAPSCTCRRATKLAAAARPVASCCARSARMSSEVLDYEPGSFHVVRHVRPKLACSGCKDILQAAAPSRPIERVMAGAGMLAQVLVEQILPTTRRCTARRRSTRVPAWSCTARR